MRRLKGNGTLIPLARGAYLTADQWNTLDDDARYRARIHAAAAVAHEPPVIARFSAAALWRLPMLGEWPEQIHAIITPEGGGRTNVGLTRHTSSRPFERVTVDGLHVTSLARTVVDIAARATLAQGVAMMDAALRRTRHPHPDAPRTWLTHDELIAEAHNVPLRQGSKRALWCAEFASGRAQRAGESLSRVSMHRAGVPAPMLQVKLRGASGRIYDVDFFWPSGPHWPHGAQMAARPQKAVSGSGLRDGDLPGLIGEFDGKLKYLDPAYRSGKTSDEVTYEEKRREDDLRAAGHGFTRWDWAKAAAPRQLASHLRNAGLRW